MTARTTAEKYMPVSVATVIGWIPLVLILWGVGEPWLVAKLNVAMAQEIDTKISTQVAPIQSAFQVLIQRNIAALRKEIADMEYRKERGDDDAWTPQDAEDLVDLKLELEAMRNALRELQKDHNNASS